MLLLFCKFVFIISRVLNKKIRRPSCNCLSFILLIPCFLYCFVQFFRYGKQLSFLCCYLSGLSIFEHCQKQNDLLSKDRKQIVKKTTSFLMLSGGIAMEHWLSIELTFIVLLLIFLCRAERLSLGLYFIRIRMHSVRPVDAQWMYQSRYTVLFVVSGSIKKLFSIDCVNIYLFSNFFNIQ